MVPDTNGQVREIANVLETRFGDAYQWLRPNQWQVETNNFRFLASLTQPQLWLKLQITIAPVQDVQTFFAQILEANFDDTQEVRYAIHDKFLWGVFHHDLGSLELVQFETALNRLLLLQEQGVSPLFNRFIETQVRQIITVAKLRGQSMETTLQTIDRFYAEGILGDMDASTYQQNALNAWRYQLERLWPEVEGPEETG